MKNKKQLYKFIALNTISDFRGKLTVIEGEQDSTFKIERVFFMHDIVSDRGGHAHIETDQIIIAIHGSYNISINNGIEKETIHMNNPTIGLYLPRLTFTSFSEISQDAVILVLANTHYDMGKSLRSFDDFISYLNYDKHE